MTGSSFDKEDITDFHPAADHEVTRSAWDDEDMAPGQALTHSSFDDEDTTDSHPTGR